MGSYKLYMSQLTNHTVVTLNPPGVAVIASLTRNGDSLRGLQAEVLMRRSAEG